MRAPSLSAVLFLVSACLRLGAPADADSGANDASTSESGASSASAARATGLNCGVDPSSGVSLCLGISSCPALEVDQEQLPNCGYRIAGSGIDLECLCGGALCPLGPAASCLDAKALLSEQTAQSVCAAIADGSCETLNQTSTKPSSTCDTECRTQCSGDPGCVVLCGC